MKAPYFWTTLFCAFAVDQTVKALTVSNLVLGESRPIIHGVFHLTLTHNTGIAFGLLQDRGWLTIPLAVAIVLAVVFYLFRHPQTPNWGQVALGLLTGGALANMIDRLFRGYVVDMFDFQVWPVFNIADICINAAVILYVVMTLKVSRAMKRETAS